MSWRRQAVLDRAPRVLVACRRLAACLQAPADGRHHRHARSVRTGPRRGPRGYDANKKVKGRKRVLMVDTQGDPLGYRSCRPTCRTATAPCPRPRSRPASVLAPGLRDRAFAGDDPAAFLQAHGIALLVGTVGRQGFQVEPRRWKVEQTFGCLQRYRRLRVDDEATHDTSR